jgi:uncharacterized FlgJ-related protein
MVLATTDAHADRTHVYRSLQDIESLFAGYRYTQKDWRAGAPHVVPRIFLDEVPSNWRETYSKRVPIAEKKTLFFRFLAPVVLSANESILKNRNHAESLLKRQGAGQALSATDLEWLNKLAAEYDVPGADAGPLDVTQVAELLRRVDVVPPSLALAQGAIESGWGTSRFADLGNSLVGQWTYSGGIAPAEQRTDTHGDHRIAAFKTTTLSAAAYVHNLNTHNAYEDFRRKRSESRKRSPYPLGLDLAATLIRYSERGEAYVKELRTIIRGNDLDKVDDATLIVMETIRLKPGE